MKNFRIFTIFSLLFMMTTVLHAQDADSIEVKPVLVGSVVDNQSGEGVVYGTVRLYSPDGKTMIVGTNTDEEGNFSFKAPKKGDYLLKLSYVGYRSISQDLKVDSDTIKLDKLVMYSDDYVLRAAVVMATAAKTQQVGDTTMFNASAYRVPEGSTLEALVKQLPGVEVSDEGTITFNGKTVTEFLVNGKDYFKGDTKVAMKNLPATMVQKIKAYDKKSDYTEMTGIDDGEEVTVLDIQTKRELNESWVSNVDVAYGTEKRYSGKIFVTRFSDNSHISAYGSMNNTGDRGFGGPRGMGGGGGLTASKSAGIDMSWENGIAKNTAKRLELGLSANYSHTGTDSESRNATQTFITENNNTRSFSNSSSIGYSSSSSVNANGRVAWNPDSLTFIMFRPNYSHSENHNFSRSLSATFNDDPYEVEGVEWNGYESQLLDLHNGTINPALLAIAVNSDMRNTFSTSKSNSGGGSLMAIRRFGSTKGRNISLRVSGNYSKSVSENFAFSDMKYISQQRESPQSQYTYTPGKNWNINARVGYAEPLGKKKNWFAEFRYEYGHSYKDSNRELYDIQDANGEVLTLSEDETYQKWKRISDIYAGPLSDEDAYQLDKDVYNSQYATYTYDNHTVSAGVRYNTDLIRFNAGLDFKPQHTVMDYTKQNIDTLVTRNVFNWAPTARLRFRFNRTTNLDFNYRGNTSQPNMTDLLETIDDTDQSRVSMGNPGLLPTWSHTFRVNYNTYNADRQAGLNAGLDGTMSRNDISSLRIYDTRTGNSYSQRQNINGNWNLSGRFMYNTGLGYEKLWTIMTHTNLSYRDSKSYVSGNLDATGEALLDKAIASRNVADYSAVFNSVDKQTSSTRTLNVGENLRIGYRASLWDISAVGNVNYQHSRNDLQSSANMDTWNFSYGLEGNMTLDCGFGFSTDIRVQSRRGYASSEMNTNEVLWNAQASMSFLKGKPLTVSVQYYDILHQQSSISRSISALQRSDSWNYGIHSYLMVHVIYKLSIFGGKIGAKADDDDSGTASSRGGRGSRGGGQGRF